VALMSLRATIVLAGLLANSASAQVETPSLRLPVIIYGSVAAADLASTVYALQAGGA
jgi:hypothetical protein